ncbi:hypothetical protein CAURIS_03210 [Corynebacterium auris]|nr:hypothetical protein CAURIS_03210 [Corynebacterium auris]
MLAVFGSDRRITNKTSALLVLHRGFLQRANDERVPTVRGFGEEDFSAPMLLCAVGLSFTDPLSGENVSVSTPGYAG